MMHSFECIAALGDRAAVFQHPRRTAPVRATIAALWLMAVAAIPSAFAADASLYNTKVYNPATKSYFELVQAKAGDSIRGATIPEIGWRKAAENAARMSYKGVHGRLAVVKTKQTNDFLLKTFQPSRPAWIGLRYWCHLNRLQWVTGDLFEAGDYANWGLIWAHDGGQAPTALANKPNCNEDVAYWPIHYWSVPEGFTWNATGLHKERYVYFVEYPTNHP